MSPQQKVELTDRITYLTILILALSSIVQQIVSATSSAVQLLWFACLVIAIALCLLSLVHFLRSRRPVIVVNRFWRNISAENYAAAWNDLSPTFKNDRWGGDFGRFTDGFANTRRIVLLGSMVVSPSFRDPEVVTIYEDSVDVPVFDVLEQLRNQSVEHFADFSQLIQQLVDDLVASGKGGVVKLSDLFLENAGDVVRWHLGEPASSRRTEHRKFIQVRFHRLTRRFRWGIPRLFIEHIEPSIRKSRNTA